MRISRYFIALIMVIGTLVQAPVLSAHAVSHAFKNDSDSTHFSNSGCDLCDAYHLQASVLNVTSASLSQPAEMSTVKDFSLFIHHPLILSFFSARAPPSLF